MATIQMTIGGGKLGFLALTVFSMMYATLSVTPSEKPSNPGLDPTIPTKATIIEQYSIQYKFTLVTELYLLHTNM